jgi:hypothetical protein
MWGMKMAYETPDGKEIKTISIEISKLQEVFEDYAADLPSDLYSILDFLEYDIVNAGEIIRLEGE